MDEIDELTEKIKGLRRKEKFYRNMSDLCGFLALLGLLILILASCASRCEDGKIVCAGPYLEVPWLP